MATRCTVPTERQPPGHLLSLVFFFFSLPLLTVSSSAGIWASNFTFAFQSTAIPTLAPSISSSFNHAELAAYLGSVFTLGNTAGIPVYGVLIDTLGRRFAMLTACCFFGAGTVACALAPGMHSLIAARALSGLGGGGLLTVSAVICTDLVHLHERGFYQGELETCHDDALLQLYS